MSVVNGLPLLSGPPPTPSTDCTQNACRKCNKEFIRFFTRATRCNHCGYSYCLSCADYQALMPRRGATSGYDPVHVCAFCIEFLNITASSKNQLKSLPLSKLRQYVDAYNIPVKGPIDKNDLVDAIIAVKTPIGTLPSANEAYYRANAVPKHRPARPRGLFSTRPPPQTQQHTSTPPSDFPRPDLDPQPASYGTYTSSTRQRQTSTTHSPPPPTPPPRFRTASQPQPPPRSSPYSTARPTPAASPPPTPNTRPTAPHSQPQPSSASIPTPTPIIPPPPLSALLAMSPSSLSRLPIHTLKQILFDARVRLPADVLEKGELVARVSAWVEEERTTAEESERREWEEREQEERERREREEHEEREMWEREEQEERERRRARGSPEPEDTQMRDEDVRMHDEFQQHHPPPSLSSSPPPKTTSIERSGLCVICQDQEANIAIVDCGHLAMCRACSELVLASSRECPLCRTRIVTEARLLRIFKT
ncbi:hypothetical protein K503DRAFT_786070 [Rhizopogon vinicolor AM-OR11-026]|uniref:RING-type domain-containing protein n=1 Tax=Rhizopogon vinicolor AM-OR11-026 TaxID=1314800 RepID=A0A1B7MN34_9AGAM|nr:hypothetical protein K503DRAFT_786070 [Rhizopogon vinicolor AM-OR11-026]